METIITYTPSSPSYGQIESLLLPANHRRRRQQCQQFAFPHRQCQLRRWLRRLANQSGRGRLRAVLESRKFRESQYHTHYQWWRGKISATKHKKNATRYIRKIMICCRESHQHHTIAFFGANRNLRMQDNIIAKKVEEKKFLNFKLYLYGFFITSFFPY